MRRTTKTHSCNTNTRVVRTTSEPTHVDIFAQGAGGDDPTVGLWEFLNTDRWIMLGKAPRGCRDVVVSLRRTPKYEAMLPQIVEMAEAGAGIVEHVGFGSDPDLLLMPSQTHPSLGLSLGLRLCPLRKSAKTTRPGVIRTHDQGIMSPLLAGLGLREHAGTDGRRA